MFEFSWTKVYLASSLIDNSLELILPLQMYPALRGNLNPAINYGNICHVRKKDALEADWWGKHTISRAPAEDLRVNEHNTDPWWRRLNVHPLDIKHWPKVCLVGAQGKAAALWADRTFLHSLRLPSRSLSSNLLRELHLLPTANLSHTLSSNPWPCQWGWGAAHTSQLEITFAPLGGLE